MSDLPQRLLLTGRLADDVHRSLAGQLPDLEMRSRPEPSPADILWADSLAGFDWPAGRTEPFRWVHAMSAGVDAFLPHRSNIELLTRTAGGMSRSLGLFVLAVLLGYIHRLDVYRRAQEQRVWRPENRLPLPRRCVLLGSGPIAQGIAEVLGSNGIHVVGVSRHGRPKPSFPEVHPWSHVEQVVADCDLLVVALPATPDTDGIVDDRILRRLNGVPVINVGRGGTLRVSALATALASGAVSFAHLDVVDEEPPPPDSWLWTHPQVSLTPHVGARTESTDVTEAMVATWAELRSGRPPELLAPES